MTERDEIRRRILRMIPRRKLREFVKAVLPPSYLRTQGEWLVYLVFDHWPDFEPFIFEWLKKARDDPTRRD